MIKNVGTLDRILRVLIAVLLIIAGIFWLSVILSIIAFVLAAVMLIVATVGFCPIYLPFKISTN